MRTSLAAAPSGAELDATERGLIGHALTQGMGGRYNLLAPVPGRALFDDLGKALPSAKVISRPRSRWTRSGFSGAQEF